MVADGFAVLAFLRSLHHSLLIRYFFFSFLFSQNSAVVPKVAQYVVSMRIRNISYISSHHIRTGPLHMVTSRQISQFLHISSKHKESKHKQKAGSLLHTEHSQQQTSQPKQSIISTYHYLQLQKILPDRFPVTHSVQN